MLTILAIAGSRYPGFPEQAKWTTLWGMDGARFGFPARLVALALVGCCLGPGCSWIFTRPASSYGGSIQHENCSTSQAPPLVDALFTTTNLVSVVYVADQDNVANKGLAVGLGLSVATLWLLSPSFC